MDNDTVFYVLGVGLTVLALIVSAVGLRFDRFPPSRAALLGGVAGFVVLVGATATFAWRNGEDEEAHRKAEQAAGELPTPAEVVAAEAAGTEVGEAEEPTATGEEGGEAPTGADGAALFESEGCTGCHSLAAANATGTTGPNLDESLVDKDAAYIEESIVDPNAEIAQGFGADIMPQNYGATLSPEQLQALVDYLVEAAGAKG